MFIMIFFDFLLYFNIYINKNINYQFVSLFDS